MTTDDASMYLDQRWGYGPEVITHTHPFDGTYQVYAHYFCSHPNEDPSETYYGLITAQIGIFAYGQLIWAGQQAGLDQSEVWEAAQINVSNNGTTVTATPLNQPIFTAQQGCTGDD